MNQPAETCSMTSSSDPVVPQPDRSDEALNYTVVAQSKQEVEEIGNAPAIAMTSHLFATEQGKLLNEISVYMERGHSREQLRLLYMNKAALTIWRAMGKVPTVIGLRNRPPQSAVLALGVPFSE